MKGASGNRGVNRMVKKDESTPPSDGRKSSGEKMRNLRNQVVGQLKTMDSKRGMDAVLDAPKRMKREWQKSGATGAITRFPIPTVLVFLQLDRKSDGRQRVATTAGDQSTLGIAIQSDRSIRI